jgi:hypothetical protein
MGSLELPPIERLPPGPSGAGGGEGVPGPNILGTFVESRSRPWGAEPVRLPLAVTGLLWITLAGNVAFSAWLIAVRAGLAPCSGLPCSVATLGDHPGWLLVLSGLAVVSRPERP